MRNIKGLEHLLLGSAAILTAAAGAQAADLPSRKAEPVQYVRICDAYGSGFFFIPGTDTCLRVGGYVRVNAQYTPSQNVYQAGDTVSSKGLVTARGGSISQIAKDQDETGLQVRGRIDLDARTQSQWGTVRTFVRMRGENNDGVRATSGQTNFNTVYNPAGNASSKLTMERMYIQFAGVTAGLMDENYNTAPGPSYFFTSNFTSGFSNGVKGLRYDAIFGGGWTWENSIESRGDFDFGGTDGKAVLPSTVQTSLLDTYNNAWNTGYNWVSTLTYEQKWGHVALSGALGDNSLGHGTIPGTLVDAGSNNPQSGSVTYGAWAIGPEIDIFFPQFAPGDEFYANFSYSVGLLGEVSGTGFNALTGDSPNRKVLGGVIREDSNFTPTSVDANGNITGVGQNAGWEINSSYTHYWTPQWRSNLGVSYLQINPPTANANVGAGCYTAIAVGGTEPTTCAGLNTQWGKGTLFAVQLNLIWSPVKNFDIGIEGEWGEMRNTLQNPNANFVAAGEPGLNESNWLTMLRLQRGF